MDCFVNIRLGMDGKFMFIWNGSRKLFIIKDWLGYIPEKQ